MTKQEEKQIAAWGKEFFPHLLPVYQVLAIQAILRAYGVNGGPRSEVEPTTSNKCAVLPFRF